MKRQSAWALTTAIMSVTLGISLVGCADQSAPNRRGMERPPLVGNGGMQNADKRELEAPKRELPTGGGKEFPGQSVAPAYVAPGSQPILYLDEVSAVATTSAAAEATGAVNPAAAAPATETAPPVTTSPAATEPMCNHATCPPHQTVLAANTCENKTCPSGHAKHTHEATHYRNDNKPYATPGKAMPVAGTGLEIPAGWGEPTVLASYPHRQWADTSVNYQTGTTWHDPNYSRPLFDRGEKFERRSPDKGVLPGCPSAYQQKQDLGILSVGNSAGVVQDLLEAPWFVGQTLALPVLMIIDRPLDQRTTRPAGKDPLYQGQLPPTGPLVPAAQPGEVRYVYPFSTTQPDMPADAKP
ncbi:MAG: hypothetical protein WCI73_01040 [Phycisphaerae bacterium]